ncbi:hypothetical protein [Streptomyces sp. NEAU-H3]|uniref:hypothetical protein n=1 Tax=Streptomyces sp. NEAU-H3 TaxID=2720636 RepID=UPI00143ACDCE|nr:hypothetical protein [Streptomyces sp. NEAU-H3]NJA55291.1 hypothetical protein [Streptomyces sp. NEAU-H3]
MSSSANGMLVSPSCDVVQCSGELPVHAVVVDRGMDGRVRHLAGDSGGAGAGVRQAVVGDDVDDASVVGLDDASPQEAGLSLQVGVDVGVRLGARW